MPRIPIKSGIKVKSNDRKNNPNEICKDISNIPVT